MDPDMVIAVVMMVCGVAALSMAIAGRRPGGWITTGGKGARPDPSRSPEQLLAGRKTVGLVLLVGGIAGIAGGLVVLATGGAIGN